MSLTVGLLTGYAVFRALGKNKKGASSMSFGGKVDVCHSIEGRIRIRSEFLKVEELGSLVVVQLTKIDGIKKVSTSHLTGSILIEYDSKKIDNELLTSAVIRLIGAEEELDRLQNSKIYNELQHVDKAINHAMLDKTAGFVDTKILLSASFIGMAAYKIASSGTIGSPSSLTLLWWAYNNLNLGGKS